jgi:transcriptional regulator with XRE-family HTH domain
MARQKTGADLLRDFLRQHELTQSAAGRALGVTPPTIHDWLKGVKRPRASMRAAIELWTSGAVPGGAWGTSKDRRRLQRIEPFAPAKTGTDEG